MEHDLIHKIGVDILLNIIKSFNAREVAKYLRLNKHWNQVLKRNNRFWKMYTRRGWLVSFGKIKGDEKFRKTEENIHLIFHSPWELHYITKGRFFDGNYRFLTIEKMLEMFSARYPQVTTPPRCPYIEIQGYVQLYMNRKYKKPSDFLRKISDLGTCINLQNGTVHNSIHKKDIKLIDCIGIEGFQKGNLLLTRDEDSHYIKDTFDSIKNALLPNNELYYMDCQCNVFRVNEEKEEKKFKSDSIKCWIRKIPRIIKDQNCDDSDHERKYTL